MVYNKKKLYICNDEIEEYYHNSRFRLKIDKSSIKLAGKGVITEEPIPNETFIDLYEGDICYSIKCGVYFVEIDETCGINAMSFPRCFAAMINDSYNSEFNNNCEMRINDNNRIEIWSIKDIGINEELFMSYGDEYWKNI